MTYPLKYTTNWPKGKISVWLPVGSGHIVTIGVSLFFSYCVNMSGLFSFQEVFQSTIPKFTVNNLNNLRKVTAHAMKNVITFLNVCRKKSWIFISCLFTVITVHLSYNNKSIDVILRSAGKNCFFVFKKNPIQLLRKHANPMTLILPLYHLRCGCRLELELISIHTDKKTKIAMNHRCHCLRSLLC